MSTKSQKALIWAGVILSLIYFGGYALLMGFLPPPSPSMGAAEVARMYSQNILQFRIGVVLMVISGGFYLPWTVVISVQMARYEKDIPVWSIMQGLGGALGTALFIAPPLFWGVAAFSPERDPAVTLIMHELAFLTFITPVSVFPLQLVSIAVIGLSKKDDVHSAFPRWVGYFTFWMIVSGECGVAALLFKSGPFAWNGLFPFWLPLILFGAWLSALVFTMLRAIGHQEQAARS